MKGTSNFALLVIGASLGGIKALGAVLGNLTPDFPVPVAVVLHRGEESDDTLCTILERHSTLPVSDAEDKTPLNPGRVYLAPPGYHLLVEPGQAVLSIDEPVLKSRPSIDVLFESAADAYGEKVAAVLMTGNNEDGARGLPKDQRTRRPGSGPRPFRCRGEDHAGSRSEESTRGMRASPGRDCGLSEPGFP